MITLAEFIAINGFFTHVELLKPLPFLGDGQTQVMDRLLTLGYGDRLVYSKLITFTANEVAELIVKNYSHKWDGLVELSSVNVLASNSRTVTETVNNNEIRNNNRDDKNLVSAYNDVTMVVNDGLISNSNDDLTGTKTRTMNDETINIRNAYNNLSLHDKNNIMNVVLKDVADFITLSIY